MAIYVDRDIASNFNGDIELDQKGDLKLANALETHKSAANFLLRTDYGDYAPNPQVGSNLGAFIGALNNRDMHEQMEYSIIRCLTDETFLNTDVSVDVVPFDIYESICLINIAGTYLISGELVFVDQDTMSYTFPYLEGEPTPITI